MDLTKRLRLLRDRLILQADLFGYGSHVDDIDAAIKRLEDPDRLKVVRCSDCRFWKANNTEEGDDSGTCTDGICDGHTTDAYWYCADGEAET